MTMCRWARVLSEHKNTKNTDLLSNHDERCRFHEDTKIETVKLQSVIKHTYKLTSVFHQKNKLVL